MRNKDIEIVEIPSSTNAVLARRVQPLIEYNTKRFSIYNVAKTVESIARDCYLQGLTDGSEVERKQREIKTLNGSLTRYYDDYQDISQEDKSEEVLISGWILVGDRLPLTPTFKEEMKIYPLAIRGQSEIELTYAYFDYGGKWTMINGWGIREDIIIAWYDVPKYREKKK
jgi:hypothetical protein